MKKSRKNLEILSPRKTHPTPELAFFNSPQSGISWHIFIAQCGVLQAVLLQRRFQKKQMTLPKTLGKSSMFCSKNMINDLISVIAKQLKHGGRRYETK